MAISQKKRFQILERDWFSCKFCWRKPPFVQLEVDHIIPKKEWWNDSVDNLHTTCFDCNRWKWGRVKWESRKDLYKTKIYDNAFKAKKYFYSEWNNKSMWSICEKTKILLNMYVNYFLVDNDAYCSWLNFPPLYPNFKVPLNEDGVFDNKKCEILFKIWWEYCDDVLLIMFDDIKDTFDEMIEEIFTDSNWNKEWEWEYWEKLNYKITAEMDWYMKGYVLRKFTLFPNIIWKKDL